MGETLENQAYRGLSRRQLLISAVATPVAYAVGAPLFAQDAPNPADLTEYFKKKERTAAPSPLEVQGATEVYLKSSLKAEYEKAKTPEGKKALVAELLNLASGEQNAANKFALYREARDHSAALGAFDSTSEAVNGLYTAFDIKLTDALNGLSAKSPKNLSKEGLNALVGMYVRLAEQAAGEQDYDGALDASKFASGKTSADKDLVARAKRLAEQIPFLKDEYETASKVALGFGDLKDPKNCHALGSYLCFMKGAWEQGLQYLANSNDGVIKLIASLEKGKPAKAEDQFSLGNAWYEHAKRAKKDSVEQGRFIGRAKYWLETASRTATGLSKKDIEAKLAEIEKAFGGKEAMAAAGGLELVTLIDPKKDSIQGEFTLTGRSLLTPTATPQARLQIPYAVPDEYELRIVASRKSGNGAFFICLAKGEKQFEIVLDGWGGNATGVDLIDGKMGVENATAYKGKLFTDDKPKTIVCKVQNNNFAVTFDGKQIISWKPNYSSVTPLFKFPNSRTIGLGSNAANYQVDSVHLITLSGKGTRLR
jgi:hypothetical protein